MEELPDNWAALWLGGNDIARPEGYSPRLRRVKRMTGGYGVLFNAKMYEDLIKNMKGERLQADVYYSKLQPFYQCYKTAPDLVTHPVGAFSYIHNKKVSY